jgi:hypothetical protein
MKKPALLSILVIVAVGVGDLAAKQQSKKIPLIRYLAALDPARESARSEAIWLALRELGHIEGQNIATEYR